MKPTHHSRAVSLSAALAAAALTFSSTAYAADYYWDNNDNTAGFGTAGGTWLNPTPGGTTGWSTDSTGASAIGSVTTATADTLFFGTDTVGLATGTVDIGAAVVNVSKLQFGKASGDITLTGGDIAMAGSTTYIRASSGGGSVSNTVTINNDLSKVSGTLTFGRQNTVNEKYVMNGVLSGGFGVDGRVTNGSGQLYLNGLNTFTGNFSMTTGQYYANTLADSGQASSLGAGNSISMGGGSGQNPRLIYTGSTATSTDRALTVNANGIVGIIAQDGALDLSGTVKANNGATTYNLYLSGTADTGTNTISGVMQDNGSGKLAVQVSNFGATGVTGEAAYWDFTGNNTYTGNTTIANGSTLKVSGAGQLGGGTYSNTLTINDSSAFHYDGDNLQTLSGTVQGSGTGGILATGSGQLRIHFNASQFSGPVIVDGGSLQFRNTTGDTAGFTSNNLNIEGGGTMAIQSSIGGNNRTTLNGKTWTFDNGGGTLTFNGGNHLFQGGGNTHNFDVTAAGSGSLIQSINGGFMNMQGSGNIEFDVADGAEDRDLTLSATWNNGLLTKNGAGTLAITGTYDESDAFEPIDINAGTLEVGGSARLAANNGGDFRSNITNDGTYKHNSSTNQTLSGVIDGTGSVVKDNTGTLTLSGANTFSGNVTVNNGTLATGAASVTSFGANTAGRTVTVDGASSVLNVAHTNATAGNGHGAENNITLVAQNGGIIRNSGTAVNRIGDVTLNGGTLEANVTDASWGSWYLGTRNGGQEATVTVGGAAASTISGTGNVKLGTNTNFNVADATGDSNTDLTVSAILDNQTATQSGAAGGFTKLGAGTMELTAANTYTGDTTISAGTLEIGGAGQLGSGTYAGAISNSGTFEYNSSANQTFSGVISGAGSVVKDNTGTLTLSANNNFSGGTTVDGGTLQLTVDGRIGNGGLTVNNGGTFSIANDDFNSLGGAITVNEGGTLSTDSTGDNAHNIGAITLNGGTLTSSGNTWFQGNWIFNGDVTVGGSALSTISGLAVGSQPSGGTFNVDDSVAGASTDLLVSADITLGSLTKTGAGTMELTGTGSYTGDTTVSAGTLSLASTYTHTGTGDFIVNGGTLEVADGVDISSSAMTISLGGVISPGNSPGTAITGAQTWEDGGTYLWEINDSGWQPR